MVLAFFKVIGLAFLAGPAAFAEPEHNVHNRDWSTTSYSSPDSSLITVYAVSGSSVPTTYSDEVASYLTTITVTPSPTPVAPYSQGNCNLHLTQWTDAGAINKPYTFEVTMWDNNKEHKIGYTKVAGFADGDPLSVESKLEDKLVVTQINPHDQSQSEYLQFDLGAQKWASTDKLDQHTPGCHLGIWDGRNNPSYRQMDCVYICIWGGGKASDGS